jgi:hypothetical protein
MQTALHLLTRDGAIRVAFSPRLTSDQYAELMLVVEAHSDTSAELRAALESTAKRWGNTVQVEEGTNGHVRTNPW